MTDGNNKKAWYAVHTYSGYEKKVKESLQKRAKSMNMEEYIFRCIVPEEKVSEMKKGAAKNVTRKVFPGYVLVEMILTDESWYIVRNTTGVTGFVGAGNKAVPLNDYEVEPLLRNLDDGEENIKMELKAAVGDQVEISDPSFKGLFGNIQEIDHDKQKVKVSVALFGGRETSIELDFNQVRPM